MPTNIVKPRQWWDYNRGHPLADGIVGYWPMWAGMGPTAFDVSGNANAGTLNGTLGWDDVGARFDETTGANLTIPITFAPVVDVGGWSLAMDFRANGTQTSFDRLFAQAPTATYLIRCQIDNAATRVVTWTLRDVNLDSNAGFYDTDKTTRLAFVFDDLASTMKMYKNGVLWGSNSGTFAHIDTTGLFYIGDDYTLDRVLTDASIGNVAIWPHALSEAQVASDAANPYALITPPSNLAMLAAATLSPAGNTRRYRLPLLGVG